MAGRAVAGIVPGDHVCATFGSDDEQQALVARYARQALRRSERFLYFAHRSDESTIRSYLSEAGIDVDAGLALGQIEIRRIEDDGEILDPEATIAALQADRLAARRDGFSALCGTAEMSWVLARPDSIDAAVRYERDVERVFAGADIAGLCQYDRRLFEHETLDRLVGTHEFRLWTGPHLTATARRGLSVSERPEGVIVLAGELDIASSAYVSARLEAAAGGGDLVVETSELEFADISGCRALVRAAEKLGSDQRMVLRDPNPALLQVLELCGWSDNGRLVLA
ncbi:MAG TPA: MEDS domain-containing protein [Solirubrobacteraceae bacterium]|nr:MEDS domain-containing protein [Solirubrobacteraceae bacterium]